MCQLHFTGEEETQERLGTVSRRCEKKVGRVEKGVTPGPLSRKAREPCLGWQTDLITTPLDTRTEWEMEMVLPQ